MKKRTWISGLVGAVALIGAAVAQQIVVPPLPIARPLVDLVKVISNGAPSAQDTYVQWGQLTNVYGYYKAGTNSVTNQLYIFPNNVSYASFQNASAITAMYVYLAASPYDGAKDCFFSIGGFTGLTIGPGLGSSNTVSNAAVTLAANSTLCYEYSASNTTWDRVQ